MKERFAAFLFPAETADWIGFLRIGLGAQLLLYALSLKSDWLHLFGSRAAAIASGPLAEGLLNTQSQWIPRLNWLVALGGALGVAEGTVLAFIWYILLVAGCGLLIGLFGRTCAITGWLLHLCVAKSGGLVSYGVDNFMTIGLFYLMLSPLPDRYSLDARWRERLREDRHLLGFFRRVLQIHLCLIYFFGGLTKSLGAGWWDGTNFWRALIRPPFNVIDPEVLVRWKFIFPAAGIAICVLETGYAFFIWHNSTRLPWLAAILAMHIGIGLAMGMYLFALVMIVLNVAAFGPGHAWSRRGEEDVDLAEDLALNST